MTFIICIQHDNECVHMCNLGYLYMCAMYRWHHYIHVCLCFISYLWYAALLANCLCPYVVYMLKIYTDIPCVWMYAFEYGMSISHLPSHNIQGYFNASFFPSWCSFHHILLMALL